MIRVGGGSGQTPHLEEWESTLREWRRRVDNSIAVDLGRRGVTLRDREGKSVTISRPRFKELLFRLREQCQCRAGTLRRLIIEGSAAILGCTHCNRNVRYRGVPKAETAWRQVS